MSTHLPRMCKALGMLTQACTIGIDMADIQIKTTFQLEELRAMLQATFSGGTVELARLEVRHPSTNALLYYAVTIGVKLRVQLVSME